jgi:hypothetical protein
MVEIYLHSNIRLDGVVPDMQDGHKLSTTFQTYINHEILELSGKGLRCSKEPLVSSVLIDCPADSGAVETHAADEQKMAVSLQ